MKPGDSLGPYRVVSELGVGGMGEVYRARDTKLNRDVAIKILPDLFAHDSERVARFAREAQTLASLNHPNIAQIYGILEEAAAPQEPAKAGSHDRHTAGFHEDHAGNGAVAEGGRVDVEAGFSRLQTHVHALVMELVEGDDLSVIIARHAGSEVPASISQQPASRSGGVRVFRPGDSPGMPLADVLPIARQIAEAVEAAHEQGVIHRDLKPANVKVRPDGTVKVLDFGLAKALDPTGASGAGSAAHSPTMTARATQMGMVIGTAAYMAPEQARGKVVDRRADIWAFGVVLYEMLTGRRAFPGDDITDVLAAVLTRDPDPSALPASTPAALRQLLARCLVKDPKGRLRDIGEARVALEELLTGRVAATDMSAPSRPAPAAGRARRLLPWAVAVAFGLTALAIYVRQPAPVASGRLVRAELNLPADVEFFSGPSISADGSRFAFVGVREGIRRVYVRRFDETELRSIPGTETAGGVVLSADGRSAAFTTSDTRLATVALSTGDVEPVTAGVSIYSGPALLGDGSVVFSRLSRLARRFRGGKEQDLATIDPAAGEISLGWPASSADDRLILFISRRRGANGVQSRLEAVPADGGARHVVLEGLDQPVRVLADRIVFEKGGALFVAGFDARRGEILGEPTRTGDAVLTQSIGGLAASVADAGALLVAPVSVLDGHLVWVSSAGVQRPLRSPSRAFTNPRLSPDGRLITFAESGTIWILDPDRGTFTRVSSEGESNVGYPVWSPDGSRVYYRSAEGLRFRRPDGEGASAVLPNTSTNDYPQSITPDGKTLLFLRLAAETSGDIYSTPVDGGAITPLLMTKHYDGGAQVSPDGKWLLYVSDESGRMEIYLRPLRGEGRRWAVSNDGGLHPVWSRDGRRIFYRSGQKMLAVDVNTAPDVRLGTPQVLFERRYAFGQNLTIANYSVGRDAGDFLMVEPEPGGRHLNLVLNWLTSVGGPR
jgi:eukaryotic-like serine/threonine-protein kinase